MVEGKNLLNEKWYNPIKNGKSHDAKAEKTQSQFKPIPERWWWWWPWRCRRRDGDLQSRIMFGCQKINVVTTTVFVNIVMISMDYWNYLFYVTINVSVVVSLRGRHQKPREKLNYRMVEY
jgi:hypothetical protein